MQRPMKIISLEGLPQFLLPLHIAECSTVLFSAVLNLRPKGGGISYHGCLSHTSDECPYTAQVQDAARKWTCIFILTNSLGQKPEEKKIFNFRYYFNRGPFTTSEWHGAWPSLAN